MSKILDLMKKRKVFYMSILVLMLVVLSSKYIYDTYSRERYMNDINMYSQNTIFYEEEPGSWNVYKKAKWTSKNTIEINFDVESILMGKNKEKDLVLVLDTSNSMDGEKLNKLKSDTESLIYYLLSKEKNKISIISFNTSATILSELSANRDNLISIIGGLRAYGRTNYNDALSKVDELLDNYQQVEGRDLVVLFLTDGYPDLENPNQVSTYNLLKNKYPFMKINGIQYEMGESTIKQVEEITDNQWVAKTTSLGNVLYAAAEATELYDYFDIEDVINTDYFYIKDSSDITASIGKVELNDNNSKIKWSMGNNYFTTGSKASLKIKAYLKDDYVDVEGLFPTNKGTNVKSKVLSDIENVYTDNTPILSNRFNVIYDSNMPEGCNNINYDIEKYFVFDNVNKKQDELTCAGYLFEGWKIAEYDVNSVNSDVFIMPEHDVNIRAVWKKVNIAKSMEGTVHEKITLYKKIENDFNNGATDIKHYTGTGSDNYLNNVYYYNGATENNNVYFANYCWKIVRTTDTGGVKLLYNGPMTNGSCNNSGSSTVISGSAYHGSASSSGYVGYMRNDALSTKYQYKKKTFTDSYEILRIDYTNATDDFYYGDSIRYENGMYILDGNVTNDTWNNIYNSTIGKYTCRNNETSCEEVYYVADIDPCDTNSKGSNQYTFKLTDGDLLSDVNKPLYFGKSITDSGLDEIVTVSLEDWLTNNSNYKNYYSCSNVYESTCSSKYYITATSNHGFDYIDTTNDYLYGHGFNYDGNNYTLTDTKNFWDYPTNYNKLSNNHYTCFNTSGTCATLYYIYHTKKNYALYIPLTDGNSVDDALDQMLYDNNVNQKDSLIKTRVDPWFKTNIEDKQFTQYLEDTIYCNDRTIDTYYGFANNGVMNDQFGGLVFSGYTYSRGNLSCKNKNDSFTVSDSIGNGKLSYPVGLLTSDEAYLAGNNKANSYIAGGSSYWTMSPSAFWEDNASSVYINSNGTINNSGVLWYGFNVRPVLSLRPEIEYYDGTGSYTDPYKIQN